MNEVKERVENVGGSSLYTYLLNLIESVRVKAVVASNADHGRD
jgi:hypothetical protein